MDRKGFESKRLWADLRLCFGIRLETSSETMEASVTVRDSNRSPPGYVRTAETACSVKSVVEIRV
jgi:hypothetical protein